MRRSLLVALLALAACAGAPAAQFTAGSQTGQAGYTARLHDSARAMEALRTLSSDSFEGRQTGTPGARRALAWIETRLTDMDVAPWHSGHYRASFTAPVHNAPDETMSGTNLLARIEGQVGPDGPITVLSAHYDHLGLGDGGVFNGADDNASGVAALLELAAWFQANPPKSTLLIAFFDAEEEGLAGSTAFVEALPEKTQEKIALNLNLDMVARADEGELYAVGSYHFPALAPLIDRVAETAPLKLLRGHDSPDWGEQDWSLMSDHAPFLRAGIPVIYLGVEDHADYHRDSDEAERIDPETFARSVDTIIAVAEAADDWTAKKK